jgi:hypothetical protein
MPPALFAFVIFLTESPMFIGAGLDPNPSVYFSWVASMTDTDHHTQLIGSDFLPGLCSKHNPHPLPPISASQVAGITGASHTPHPDFKVYVDLYTTVTVSLQ